MADPSTIDGTFLILQEPATWWDSSLQILQASSIIGAACMAIWGIRAWRRETLGRRKIELAEEMLASRTLLKRAIDQSAGHHDLPKKEAAAYEARLKSAIRRDEHGTDDVSKDLAKAVGDMEAVCRPILAGEPTFVEGLTTRWRSFLSRASI